MSAARLRVVIPAQAGIQSARAARDARTVLDSRLRGNDGEVLQ